MRVLIVGDVVGKSGVKKIKEKVPDLIKNEDIDFCIINGENAANGKGIRLGEYYQILKCGADCITMGNHLYYRKEMAEEYAKLPRLVIPANVTDIVGNKRALVKKNNILFGVINAIGRAEMGELFEKNTTNPFTCVDEQINILKTKGAEYIFVDFHAEATAEKIAMGYFLDGKVNCIFGTHTHVQTADETIFESGTAYITDIGMTGPKDSVIGLKKELALKRFVNNEYARYECSENEAIFNAMIVEFDDETKKAISIKRIYE